MVIISHRGFWLEQAEKNARSAFLRSVDNGFGTETDVRDSNGQLVIAHNMPAAGEELMSFDEFLQLFLNGPHGHLLLAINIKADGLQEAIKSLLEKHQFGNYFVFDMSVPDTLGYSRMGLKFFTRVSEYEPVPAMYSTATGVWVDAFDGLWYTPEIINQYLADGKKVCFVSPDLHQRDPQPLWSKIAEEGWNRNGNVILCTDFPTKAQIFLAP